MKGIPRSYSITIILLFLEHVVSFSVQLPTTSRRRSIVTMLASSSSSSTKSNATAKTTTTTVVYQKVIRMPLKTPDVLFLGNLVEYLQDVFQLPERLPMVYEKQIFEDDAESDDCDDKNRKKGVMMRFDSKLSPRSEATALNVQVVGIYSNDKSELPDMAMVVVDKDAHTNLLPPMMQGLFADSETKILNALDRGLEDFMNGKIKSLDGMKKSNIQLQTYQEGRQAMLDEILSEEKSSNDFIEADIVSKDTSENTSERQTVQQKILKQREAVLKTMQAPASSQPKIKKDLGLEYTIQAAKEAQELRKRRKEQGREDFAVVAARNARGKVKEKSNTPDAAKRSQKANSSETSKPSVSETTSESPSLDQLNVFSIRPPVLDPKVSGGQRRLMKSISTPTQFADQEKMALSNKNSTRTLSSATGKTTLMKSSNVSHKRSEMQSNNQKTSVQENRKRRNVDKDKRQPKISSSEAAKKEQEKPKNDIVDTQQDLDVDMRIRQTAVDALTEMEKLGKEMTAEEILEDVVKFGEKQEQETTVGGGFATGAFEKAKEILRQQTKSREGKKQQETKTKEQALNSNQNAQRNIFKEMSPDEELRRMFEAGQRIADGRMTLLSNQGITSVESTTATTEDEIDAIIDSDTSVSRHARILDDELAELEVRINKSPGESQYGRDNNPLFDIFSGPEVYDPNVDPETAVNWPGAKPGTKSVRLPKQLDDAVKQANFAAKVLMNLQEKQSPDEPTKYTIGKRELSEQDIRNLRTVVEEAVEIGIMEDPLIILDENARLQMLVDELFHQPEERIREIASNYKDLLLSDNFSLLVKNRLDKMAKQDLEALRHDDNSLSETHARERELLGQLIVYAQLLLKEAQALGAELETQHLEVIRSICKVAMDPTHRTEEETAHALTDAVKDMRPLFDDSFVAYLKYAIAEEEGRLARAGVLDDPEHNQWLFVLKIVQQGVYKELSIGINRYLEHIWYILRMETPVERRMLLEKLVDVMPTLDVRPFVKVVDNIIGALGDSVKGEFDGVTPLGEMTNKLLQLHRDVKEILPPERIAEKSKDADEWAAKQRQRLLEQRNLTKQRLKAAQDTEYLDGELLRRGEQERFD